MGCLVSTVACCFCSSAASLCCACMPSCKSSTSARIMFSMILVIAILLSAVALIPNVRSWLSSIPALCTPYKVGSFDTSVSSGLDCDLITGYGAVYRLCFATTMFYLLFAILMIRVRSSQDPRSKIQNGFWFFKFLIWFSLVIGAFFIPVEGFTMSWMIIGMLGGALYIMIQLVLLIDFAHSWNENWIEAYENTGAKCYAFGLVFFTLSFFMSCVVGVGLLFHFYAGAPECSVNKAIISLNLILCVFVSVVSILPIVRQKLTGSGLLQSSLISFYVIFLTWSALTNGRNPVCNPTLHFDPAYNSTAPTNDVELKFGWHIAFGLAVLVFSVVYSTIRTSSHTAIGKLSMAGIENTILTESRSVEKQERGQTVWDDEEDGVAYNYSAYHTMLLLATLYAMVTLTSWLKPSSDLKALGANMASYWVRIVSSWACLFLYFWTLISPIIFADRQF